VIENPKPGWWHVTQARPFVPRLLKNSLFVSITPFVDKFDETPAAFGKSLC
jgi:hypothetical protein